MKRYKKIIFILSLFILSNVLQNIQICAETINSTVIQELSRTKQKLKKVYDFEGKKEDAEKWGQEQYLDWQHNKLNKDELKLIKKYSNDFRLSKQIDILLEKTRGKITDIDYYFGEINLLDKALQKEKTNHKLYVYQRVDEEHFGYDKNFLKSGMEINHNNFEIFKEGLVDNHAILNMHGYMETSLHGETSNLSQAPPIYIRIEVPEGVSSGYIGGVQENKGENNFLLERGQAIQILDASIINQKGREFIKLEAKLIPKEKLKQVIEQYNEELNNELALNKEYPDLIHMDLTGRWITDYYIQTKDVVQSIKNINHNLLLTLQKFAADIPDGTPHLIIADYKPTEHEAFEHMKGNPEDDNALGLHKTDGGHNTIVSLLNNIIQEQDEHLTTLHELGHAVDDLIFKQISKGDVFNMIYQKEKDFFPNDGGAGSHAKSDVEEFFAECFGYYYLNNDSREKLKNGAPTTYNFFEKGLQI
ncbi:hypothetical protein M3644_24415 [Bacillus cereus]|uniref:ADP-ribosyltransferase n=1 Tax=Bacillus cereus TaxID=1396 RepID=UPI00203F7731|nr:ADP-ribosyltransferase [Bacillus cereus]MCM3222911.1 hypothetical protein [Bacillus cereus]MEC3336042.1 ADP-ribosyltransferase [Bacillus cereus]